MIREHKFVVDPVLSSLARCLEEIEEGAPFKLSLNDTNLHGRVKLNLINSKIRPTDKEGWSTCLLISPVSNGALRCFTDSLQDRCLSCVCPSYNQNSELDLWNSTTGLLAVHWNHGVWERVSSFGGSHDR